MANEWHPSEGSVTGICFQHGSLFHITPLMSRYVEPIGKLGKDTSVCL